MLKVITQRLLKIIGYLFMGIGACFCAIVIYAVIVFFSTLSSAEYESDCIPEIIKPSPNGKYLAKVYHSNWQPPFWTFRPLRSAGVYIQRIGTKQEWFIAKLKDHSYMSGDIAWPKQDSLLIYSDEKVKTYRVDVDGQPLTIKLRPALKWRQSF